MNKISYKEGLIKAELYKAVNILAISKILALNEKNDLPNLELFKDIEFMQDDLLINKIINLL
ncbi:414_t:CDS:2 [Cetraspora pellucida]|uniref:414_t:CDS:1 n=1 Tax=Cetraspora pellucida TaxID=1433469 RepID=A0A9N9CUN6_9GLOM|nr:414_t:CDS:2 [Cetraspora pellucida]